MRTIRITVVALRKCAMPHFQHFHPPLPPHASATPTPVSRRYRSRSGARSTAQPGVVCRSQPGRDPTWRSDLSPSHHHVGEADPDQVTHLLVAQPARASPVPAVSNVTGLLDGRIRTLWSRQPTGSRAGAGDFARATRLGGVVRMRPPAPDPAVLDAAFRATGISRARGVVDVRATSPRHDRPHRTRGQRRPRFRPRQTRALRKPRPPAAVCERGSPRHGQRARSGRVGRRRPLRAHLAAARALARSHSCPLDLSSRVPFDPIVCKCELFALECADRRARGGTKGCGDGQASRRQPSAERAGPRRQTAGRMGDRVVRDLNFARGELGRPMIEPETRSPRRSGLGERLQGLVFWLAFAAVRRARLDRRAGAGSHRRRGGRAGLVGSAGRRPPDIDQCRSRRPGRSKPRPRRSSRLRAQRSASATKTDTPLVETPQAITVITRDQMVDQGCQRCRTRSTTRPACAPTRTAWTRAPTRSASAAATR